MRRRRLPPLSAPGCTRRRPTSAEDLWRRRQHAWGVGTRRGLTSARVPPARVAPLLWCRSCGRASITSSLSTATTLLAVASLDTSSTLGAAPAMLTQSRPPMPYA